MSKIIKPSFEVVPAVTTIKVGDKVYNASPVGPGNWHQVRLGDYGEGFKQGTFGDNLTLVHAAYLNRDSREAKGVVKLVQNNWLTGNTALYGGKDLIYAVDFPEVRDGRIVIDEKGLNAKLGSKQEGEVIFGKGVRALSRSQVRHGEYNPSEALKSAYPILITGDEEASEKTAQILKPGTEIKFHPLDIIAIWEDKK